MHEVPMGDSWDIQGWIKTRLNKKIRKNGVAAYELNDFRAELAALRRSLRSDIQILHLLDAEHSLMFLPGWLKKIGLFKRVPKIIAMFHQPVDLLEKLINRQIAQLADCVLTVSPDQKEYFQSFIPREKVKMILHGIDTAHFCPGTLPPSGATLRCVAGGVWLRDYDSVIKTARLLRERKEIEFHIVASKFSVPADLSNITVHRNISDGDLLNLYQSAHVLFMPLKAATANNVLLEGLACGLPVVSSDLHSVRTYFPGKEAILVKDNNPAEFAEILSGLARDRSKLARLSSSARERAEQLSWRNISREYADLYRVMA